MCALFFTYLRNYSCSILLLISWLKRLNKSNGISCLIYAQHNQAHIHATVGIVSIWCIPLGSKKQRTHLFKYICWMQKPEKVWLGLRIYNINSIIWTVDHSADVNFATHELCITATCNIQMYRTYVTDYWKTQEQTNRHCLAAWTIDQCFSDRNHHRQNKIIMVHYSSYCLWLLCDTLILCVIRRAESMYHTIFTGRNTIRDCVLIWIEQNSQKRNIVAGKY